MEPTIAEHTDMAPFEKEVSQMFSQNGLLSQIQGFEFRPQQQELSRWIAKTLTLNTHLAVEAGTGVGKSLAYLVPAILHATRQKRKAIVSTHTINLQEQLIFKDIPLIQKLLPIDFSAALLKGRRNYCCASRLERSISNAKGLFTSGEFKELERIRQWSLTTKDGSLSDFGEQPDPTVWAQVCSERHLCTQKICGRNPRCFYQVARRRALSADILILNHTLFFTLLGGIDEEDDDASDGYLFPGDFAIFDEAHTVESVASRHVGINVSQYSLRTALHRLYNPRTKKGLFQLLRHPQGVKEISELLPKMDAFFESLASRCSFTRGREFRVRQPGIAEPESLTSGLSRVCELLGILSSKCEDSLIKGEVQDSARRLRQQRGALLDFVDQSLPGCVYWIERTGKRELFCTLNAAPIDLSAILGRFLFAPNTSCILTSATLSAESNRNLDYFRERIGATTITTHQIGSPFRFDKQMTIFLVRKMPDPRDGDYEKSLEKWIAHFTEKSQGRAFVLFTSHRTLQTLAQRMEAFFRDKGWQLLVQGDSMPRTKMIEEFKKSPSAVLFGTESFWSGVDVAGEALSNVIITRLPFTTPDHPLTEAKLEAIKAAGRDSFQEYSLPEAILKLRQGVGRLIRTKKDQGIVVILDSRVLTKPYGRAFLQAVPKCRVEIVE